MAASGSSRQSSAYSYQQVDQDPAGGTATSVSGAGQKAPAPAAPRARASRKSASAFRTISEVSQELDVPQHVLRFWETKFSQLRPMKRGGGRRYYRPEDVQLLREIKTLLHRDCYTIKGVQKLLKERRAGEAIVDIADPDSLQMASAALAKSPDGLDPALRTTLSALLEELRDLRRALSGDAR